MKILIADDDRELCNIIKRGLQENGYTVDIAHDGKTAEYRALCADYDLIILDIMMPKRNGIDVCHNLRAKKINTSILILTGRDSEEDIIKGFNAEADDYLVKPFVFKELIARIRALLRRATITGSGAFA